MRKIIENPSHPEITTAFCIAGRDFDVDQCTRELCMLPDHVWNQTRPDLIARPDLNTAEWCVQRERRPYYTLDEAVNEVLAVILPATERIRRFVAAHAVHASVICLVKVRVDRPLYELRPSTMENLAALGATFRLDVMDLTE